MNCASCGTDNPVDALRCRTCGAELSLASAQTVSPDAAGAAWVPTRRPTPTASSLPPRTTGPGEGLTPGEVLAERYEIREMLGRGGMGAVFKAWDRELERTVALKVIRTELAEDPAVLHRFKQELILARQVTHRNVIRIFDIGQERGIRFITMEFVEGRDLRTILSEKGKLDPAEAVSIIRQICLALEAAHTESVIHRDLKPQNVLIDEQGKVVVMDFGIARSLESSSLTQTGTLIGTPDYMSPEQAQGEKVDTRSDLFALGILFYELLTGKSPYESETAMGTLLKRIQERAAPVVDVDSAVPRALSDIVAKCLARDRANRYQTAAEILADLDRWQGITPLSGAPAPGLLGRGIARWIFAAATVFLAAVVLFILFRTKPSPVTETGKPVTILIADFDNSTSEAVFDGTIESTFTLAMEGAPFITSFRRGDARRVAAQLRPEAPRLDESLAKLVARREGIAVVISGAIQTRAGRYDLSVRATDVVSDKMLVEREAEAESKDQVLGLVGRLAAPVRKTLGDLTPESAQMAAIETFSAGNLEAAHQYSRAQELQWAGKVEEAIDAYQRAVSLDPNLGRAYAGLAAVNANLGRNQASEKYYKQAMAHLDRMSEREKFRTLGGYYISVRNADKAIEVLTNLVQMFPSDSSGFSNLAYAYSLRRNLPKALETGRRAVEIYPKNLLQRNNVAIYAMYAGDFETAKQEAQSVLESNPEHIKAHVVVALSELAQDHPDKARVEYQRLAELGKAGASFAASGLADVALYEGKAPEAAAILEPQIAVDLAANNDHLAATRLAVLASAQLHSGQRARAFATANHALKLAKSDTAAFDVARFFIEAGDESTAQKIAADLGNEILPEPRAYSKLILGELKLGAGNPREAARLFVEAAKLVDTWIGRVLLGRAYLENGSFTEANAELETALDRRGEATALYLDELPTYRLFPPVLFYLGRARLGLKSAAAPESFRAYLAIRKNSGNDPLAVEARRLLLGP